MKYYPTDYNNYTKEQRHDWHYIKSPDEKREIILKSYLSTIADENGNLDHLKLLEIILDLQDRVDELEHTCERTDSYYD
jgi:hypothetical protein